MEHGLYDACGRWLAACARVHRLLSRLDLRGEAPEARKHLQAARGLVRRLEDVLDDLQQDHTPREDGLPTKEECEAELWAYMLPQIASQGVV